MIYTLQRHKGICITNFHLIINLYDRKGSNFAPIVIYTCVYFTLHFIQKRSKINSILFYGRESLDFDHEKRDTQVSTKITSKE